MCLIMLLGLFLYSYTFWVFVGVKQLLVSYGVHDSIGAAGGNMN